MQNWSVDLAAHDFRQALPRQALPRQALPRQAWLHGVCKLHTPLKVSTFVACAGVTVMTACRILFAFISIAALAMIGCGSWRPRASCASIWEMLQNRLAAIGRAR